MIIRLFSPVALDYKIGILNIVTVIIRKASILHCQKIAIIQILNPGTWHAGAQVIMLMSSRHIVSQIRLN